MLTGIEEIAAKYKTLIGFVEDVKTDHAYHSYIVSCEDALLADAFVTMMCAVLMCGENGCFECDTCRKVFNKTHIDVNRYPKEGRKQISSASDIDDFNRQFALSAYEGGKKVFVFNCRESLRDDWQNKLLKALEEPPQGVYMIISAVDAERLLPTVKSRCRILSFPVSDDSTICEYLLSQGIDKDIAKVAATLAGGSFERAMRYSTDRKYTEIYNQTVDLVSTVENSRELLPHMNRLYAHRDSAALVSAFSAVFAQIMKGVGSDSYRFVDIERARKLYPPIACAEIIGIIDNASRLIEGAVNNTAVTDDLLLRIMEVKYKCRQ